MLLFNPFEDGKLFFRPVEENEIFFNSWIEVKKDQAIVILYPLDLTAAMAEQAAPPAWVVTAAPAAPAAWAVTALAAQATEVTLATPAGSAAWRAPAAVAASGAAVERPEILTAWDDYKAACAEAESVLARTGKIEGHVAVVVATNQLIWISHYDVNKLRSYN